MKNYIHKADRLTVAAPADVLSGEAFIINKLFLVALYDALSGAQVVGLREGVVELPKLSTDDMQVGESVNWNNATKELQEATTTLDGVGKVVEDAGVGVTTVKVVLTP